MIDGEHCSDSSVPLRVAALVEQFWHRIPGGTARATEETLSALIAAGSVEPKLISAWHRSSEGHRAPPALRPVTTIPLPRPALYEAWTRLDRPTVERWVGPVDVAWASSMIPIASRAPLVATVHDLEFLANPQLNSARGRAFFPRVWEATKDRAAMIVCPSQVVADECAVNGVDTSRLRVVPWGVRPPICPSEAAGRVAAELGLPDSFVLWVGTVEPRKNLPRLVEAMGLLGDDLALAVVGPDGWDVDGEDLLAPLGARVHRLGRVDEYELSALYRSATVFALPSLAEGFGLPVLEAMAHGTPVVTSRGTATEEVAGDAGVLVDPTDPASIAAGIEAAASGDTTTLQRIERGVTRAGQLTWEHTAARYAEIFEAVAGRR
ncbi:MAG: glycosyltransferase family 4 protein [Acidimicrobiales bacterium]